LHVDIVILSLDKFDFTKQCIESVKEHTTFPHHIIVVDNGSSQETVDKLRGIDGIKLILNGVNKGCAGGRNIGSEACNGEYVVHLDNDAKVTKGWLEEMIKMAESDDKVGIVGCKLLYPDGTIQHAGVVFKGLLPFHIGVRLPKEFYSEPRECKAVTFACALIKREVFDNGVWFDERYYPFLFEDMDYCFQALEKGWKIMYCPDAIVYHYEHATFKNGRLGRVYPRNRNVMQYLNKIF